MERKIQKLLVVAGALMSVSVALLPLTSYAAITDPEYSYGYECNQNLPQNHCASGNAGPTTVTVDVKPAIQMYNAIFDNGNAELDPNDPDSATSGSIQVYPDTVRTGRLAVDVRSALPFTITLSAAHPYLANAEDDSFIIPARAEITVGKSGWGIKKSGAEGYTALTTTEQVFYDSTANNVAQWINFEVGVAASPNIPQGTYSTEVTVTAVSKQ